MIEQRKYLRHLTLEQSGFDPRDSKSFSFKKRGIERGKRSKLRKKTRRIVTPLTWSWIVGVFWCTFLISIQKTKPSWLLNGEIILQGSDSSLYKELHDLWNETRRSESLLNVWSNSSRVAGWLVSSFSFENSNLGFYGNEWKEGHHYNNNNARRPRSVEKNETRCEKEIERVGQRNKTKTS